MKIARGGAHSFPWGHSLSLQALRFLFGFSVSYENRRLCIYSKLLSSSLGPVSQKSRQLFRPGKLLCVCRVHIFNYFENNEMKLSVNEAKWTGLWARNGVTIQ